MRFIIILLALLIFNSCSSSKKQSSVNSNSSCCCFYKEGAIIKARSIILEKRKMNLANYKVSIEESSESYKIIYTLKNDKILGGGGMIELNKKNCKILAEEYYQ